MLSESEPIKEHNTVKSKGHILLPHKDITFVNHNTKRGLRSTYFGNLKLSFKVLVQELPISVETYSISFSFF